MLWSSEGKSVNGDLGVMLVDSPLDIPQANQEPLMHIVKQYEDHTSYGFLENKLLSKFSKSMTSCDLANGVTTSKS